ncbi:MULTISPECIES: DM13 domain-containing protein [unclassified Moorena]|uniref:DM13 domain-containing protein n=1 Tax=unclassified Moorena TaxID=2683338 RepID=UPI0013BAF3BC|nr:MULTISPECIES: DM13 domain-containing protein [unclassified Moorena]NEO16805.1 DM13 domain-containing protein [Moorena sp. SIO3E8]NEQ03383.1 DM13 domain-containing protein [Moorena sp. SIO3F7]NEQ85016.1 DM13 domain-containing protein [Moorena sp. SIO2I5]
MKRLIVGGLSVLLMAAATPAVQAETTVVKQKSLNNALVSQRIASTIATGSFITVDRGHRTQGNAKIVNENGKRYLEFDQSFKTGSGPEVKVLLYRNSSVPRKIRPQDYVTLARLQKFSGAQRYAIPDDLNLDEFGSVAVWCRRFNITFGYASL